MMGFLGFIGLYAMPCSNLLGLGEILNCTYIISKHWNFAKKKSKFQHNMKTSSKVLPSERIFERLLIKQRFRLEVHRIRTIFDIPVETGFKNTANNDEQCKWWNKLTKLRQQKFGQVINGLAELSVQLLETEFSNAKAFYDLLDIALYAYVLYDKDGAQIYFHRNSFNIVPFLIDNNFSFKKLGWIKKSFLGGMLLAISSQTTKQELLDFINMSPRSFMRMLRPKRVRKYIKSEEHQKILRIWHQYSHNSIAELRKIADLNKSSGYSKYHAISKILDIKYGIEITADNLKILVYRFRKRNITS